MAGGAQRHEVRFIVRAALGQRYDVVNLLRRGDPATLLAPLAQGVGSDEAVAYPFPNPAVSLLHSRVALVAFVSRCFLLGMFLAEPSVGKRWAARAGAGALGSARHVGTSAGIGKGAGRSLCGAPCVHFYIMIISKIQGVIK